LIEPTIVLALTPLFGAGRIFPDVAPAGAARPFLVYQQVGGVPSNTLCGNTDKQNARIQFTVWTAAPAAGGGGRPQANTLMRAAEKILTDPPIRGVSQGSLVAEYDEPTKTYGARQDFSVWWDNSP
jgi:hypothetical protein